jgi:hypothetical protein
MVVDNEESEDATVCKPKFHADSISALKNLSLYFFRLVGAEKVKNVFFQFLAPTKRNLYKLRNLFCLICSSCCSLSKTLLLAKNSCVVLKLRVPNQLHLKGQNTVIRRVL